VGCLIRVAMVLFPQYGINQIKSIYFTSEDTEANYGVLLSAYGLENVVGPMLVFQGYSTCKAEKNYVLKDRPTTIAQFCVLALKHLDDDDFGQLQEKAQEQKSSRINKNHVGDIASKETFKKRKLASQKVAVLFQELGYTVGRVLDENDEDEDLSLSLKDTHEVKAMADMKHFIKEFNQLNWDAIVENKDGKLPSLSLRESACLHRLHNELYGKL